QDTVAKAILEMAQPTDSVVMPKIPEIVSFWPAMDAVINDTYKGNFKPADYQAKLDKLVQDTSKVAKE
ncbi:sugar ABC transporter substrate-binding protein, partial [Enterococcus faecalis]